MVYELQGLAKPVIRVLLQHILSRRFLKMCWMLCSMISVETTRTRMCWAVAHRGLSVILNQVCEFDTRLRTCGFPSIGPGRVAPHACQLRALTSPSSPSRTHPSAPCVCRARVSV